MRFFFQVDTLIITHFRTVCSVKVHLLCIQYSVSKSMVAGLIVNENLAIVLTEAMASFTLNTGVSSQH